jgi:hypothetical protein
MEEPTEFTNSKGITIRIGDIVVSGSSKIQREIRAISSVAGRTAPLWGVRVDGKQAVWCTWLDADKVRIVGHI